MAAGCPHGFPKPANCVECMMDGPVGPVTPADTQRLRADRTRTAMYDGRCARNTAHEIVEGDPIGYVETIGWCCGSCYVS